MPFRAITIFFVALLAAACGSSEAETPVAQYGTSIPQPPQPSPSPPLEILPVEAITPGLKATFAGGLTKDLIQAIEDHPGVAHATGMTLGQGVIHTSLGETSLTIAAVDPLDFRPLSPQVTANASFIWQELLRHRIILAHEEHERLKANPGTNLFALGTQGQFALSVGGVAANGVPNWSGAIVSEARGAQLGLGVPTLLLVGLKEGQDVEKVRKALKRSHPQIHFETNIRQRAFLTGMAASKAFGSFTFTTNPDGTISPDPNWVKANIIEKSVPIFGKVRCHRIMFPQLIAALTEVEQRGLAGEIFRKEYGGCFVPRFIDRDPGRALSMHAWGIAMDFNVASNPLGAEPKMNREIVQIFENWGFRWGGRWSPPDGHHFELAAIIKANK